MPKVTFTFDGNEEEIEAPKGKPLLHIGLDAGIPIEHACGGNGFCTTCMCKIIKGMEHLNERNDREENMGITDDPYRLTCQAEIVSDGEIVVEIPED